MKRDNITLRELLDLHISFLGFYLAIIVWLGKIFLQMIAKHVLLMLYYTNKRYNSFDHFLKKSYKRSPLSFGKTDKTRFNA
jgi:hypothetical protein